jgi:hypothetical protein
MYFVVLDFLWHLARHPASKVRRLAYQIPTPHNESLDSIYLLPDATLVLLAFWTVCPSFHHRRMIVFNTTAYVLIRSFPPSGVVGNVLDARSWKMLAQSLARRRAEEEASTDLVLPLLDHRGT